MTKRELTCDDCYFRREALCALLVPVPCPTFRLAAKGQLAPPRQPRLVLRDPLRPPRPAPGVTLRPCDSAGAPSRRTSSTQGSIALVVVVVYAIVFVLENRSQVHDPLRASSRRASR